MNKLVPIIIVVVLLVVGGGAGGGYFYFKTKHSNSGPGKTINVVNLGADASGTTDSSAAIQSAWEAACQSGGKTTIVFPDGKYLVAAAMTFSGAKCKGSSVNFNINKATLLAPPEYTALANSQNWFLFENVDGVTISGGVFDGRGTSLWTCKHNGGGCPDGTTTLRFVNSKNILLNGVQSLNSQLYHISFNGCKKVKVQGVTITALGDSPNTDGIHVELSEDVNILKTTVGTGDDCVSVGPGTTRLWIENMACGPGHGISIGSLGKEPNEPGVEGITVKSSSFTGTQNGVRIKSWAKQSSGYVKDVIFQDLTMDNAQNPIIIDQHYCPNHDCPDQQVSGIKISDLTYQRIHGSSATPVAVKLDCSSQYHCTDLQLTDIQLTYNGGAAQYSCTNVDGPTPDLCKQ